MKKLIFLVVWAVTNGSFALADCSTTVTTGVGYFGAKQNCEVILQGQAASCQPQGFDANALWTCQCAYNCSDENPGSGPATHHTVTTGVGYFGAKQNCEVILRGQAYSCQPQGADANALWTCQCTY